MKVRLKTISNIETWWVFMHHSLDRPSSYEWNAFEVRRGHDYQVTFALVTFHLLSHPYRTNCKDYPTETEFTSNKECTRVCKLRQMLSNCGHLSHKVDVLRGEQIENDSEVRFARSPQEEQCVNNISLNQICRRMCSNVDCVKHYYKPIMISSKDEAHEWIDIDVMIPSEPITDYYNIPQIPTIEFLCYIASVLSLWFGFSILSLCYWLKVLFIRIKPMNKFKPSYTSPKRLAAVIARR